MSNGYFHQPLPENPGAGVNFEEGRSILGTIFGMDDCGAIEHWALLGTTRNGVFWTVCCRQAIRMTHPDLCIEGYARESGVVPTSHAAPNSPTLAEEETLVSPDVIGYSPAGIDVPGLCRGCWHAQLIGPPRYPCRHGGRCPNPGCYCVA